MTSTLTNQRQVFKACLTQTEQVSDDVTRKMGPLDFNKYFLAGNIVYAAHCSAQLAHKPFSTR